MGLVGVAVGATATPASASCGPITAFNCGVEYPGTTAQADWVAISYRTLDANLLSRVAKAACEYAFDGWGATACSYAVRKGLTYLLDHHPGYTTSGLWGEYAPYERPHFIAGYYNGSGWYTAFRS